MKSAEKQKYYTTCLIKNNARGEQAALQTRYKDFKLVLTQHVDQLI